MERPTVGSVVKSLDDRVVGTVSHVNGCCVRFECRYGGSTATATWEGLFDVQHRVVTLIYAATEPHRYGCPVHPGAAAEAQPVRTSVQVVRLNRRRATVKKHAVRGSHRATEMPASA